MSDIVPFVSRAIVAAKIDWQERHPIDAETCSEVQARAAIKATVKHLMDNVSENMAVEGYMRMDNAPFPEVSIAVIKAALAAFLSDFEKQEN